MDIEAFRKAGHDAVESIAKYYESLEELPVCSKSEPGDIKALIPGKPPLKGEPFEEISKDFERLILPGITHWQHPSFFALYPANSTFESIIADMYSTAVNTPGFNWSCSPIATDLEFVMMDWVAELFGLSEIYKSTSKTGGGTIVGTASEACLTVAIAARERALQYEFEKLSNEKTQSNQINHHELSNHTSFHQRSHLHLRKRAQMTGKLVIYGSTQTHSMGHKTALILGLEWRGIEVSKEDGWGLRGDKLRKAIEFDVENGFIPCMLIVTLGTTNVGAMDFLDELVKVAKDYPTLWIHVDAAWAGVYLSLPEFRKKLYLEIINQSDSPFNQNSNGFSKKSILLTSPGVVHSFCTNLHKSGLVSFDCSIFFIRHKNALTETLKLTPHYLHSKEGDLDTAIDFRNWGIPLGRRFRSLKIFFVLRSFGVEGFRAELRRTIELTDYLQELIRQDECFETIQEPSLALTIFRMKRPLKEFEKEGIRWPTCLEEQEKRLDQLNLRLAEMVQATNQISFTPSVVDGKRCFRIAIGRMSRKCHIDQAWELFQTSARALK